jgi:hypothetical protein
MAEGTDTYKGLAVPLFGQSEIRANDATYDIITLTQYASGTGDFLVCQSENGTEKFVINYSGDIAGALELTSSITVAGASTLTGAVGCGAVTSTSTITAGTGLTVTAGDATISAGDVIITKGYYLRFTSWAITPPTTGLTLGDTFLLKTSTNAQIAICVDGSDTLRYLNTTSA